MDRAPEEAVREPGSAEEGCKKLDPLSVGEALAVAGVNKSDRISDTLAAGSLERSPWMAEMMLASSEAKYAGSTEVRPRISDMMLEASGSSKSASA